MSRKIKLHTFHVLFQLFAFLADKTGGWRVFVRPKLLLGSLIVGLGLTSCNKKADNQQTSSNATRRTDSTELVSKSSKVSIKERNSAKNETIKQSKRNHSIIHFVEPMVTCYDTEVILQDSVEIVDDNSIYETVEQLPQYPGGDSTLISFVQKNLTQLPVTQCYNGVSAKVICRFVVEKDGSVSNITVIRSLDTTCDKEAIRVLKLLPKFIPGKQDGRTVRVYYTIPVVFKP
jgi:TonB family protein